MRPYASVFVWGCTPPPGPHSFPCYTGPSVWCPFSRRGAQCAPAYLCLHGDVPPRGRASSPVCTAPSVWSPFFRRGAQCAPAGSRRSHPAGADIIRPMFRRPAQPPPHNALSRPLWAAQFPRAFSPSTPEKRPPSAFLRRTEIFSCIWGKSPCHSLLHRLEWE